jgi:hypothetical protein
MEVTQMTITRRSFLGGVAAAAALAAAPKVLIPPVAPVRAPLLGNYYVDCSFTGASDGSALNPFRTIQQAIDLINEGLDGESVTINVAPGEYDDRIGVTRGRIVSLIGAGIGAGEETVIRQQIGHNAVTVDQGAHLDIRDVSFALRDANFPLIYCAEVGGDMSLLPHPAIEKAKRPLKDLDMKKARRGFASAGRSG